MLKIVAIIGAIYLLSAAAFYYLLVRGAADEESITRRTPTDHIDA